MLQISIVDQTATNITIELRRRLLTRTGAAGKQGKEREKKGQKLVFLSLFFASLLLFFSVRDSLSSKTPPHPRANERASGEILVGPTTELQYTNPGKRDIKKHTYE